MENKNVVVNNNENRSGNSLVESGRVTEKGDRSCVSGREACVLYTNGTNKSQSNKSSRNYKIDMNLYRDSLVSLMAIPNNGFGSDYANVRVYQDLESLNIPPLQPFLQERPSGNKRKRYQSNLEFCSCGKNSPVPLKKVKLSPIAKRQVKTCCRSKRETTILTKVQQSND
eukprot:TRINITY_DN10759_c0_g5_i1.p1 TRINITY_DN10759_c0_g5~~TRINITY_DN10759_c0_g5_i1.p1  ORF type:complete len:170 (+),score=30.56 TRINITY_DN10759_c0_g5_i1:33-542(+)